MRVVMKWGGRLLAIIASCSGGSLDRLTARPCLRGSRGARFSSISPVAIFITRTAQAVSLCGRRSPFGPMGMPESTTGARLPLPLVFGASARHRAAAG